MILEQASCSKQFCGLCNLLVELRLGVVSLQLILRQFLAVLLFVYVPNSVQCAELVASIVLIVIVLARIVAMDCCALATVNMSTPRQQAHRRDSRVRNWCCRSPRLLVAPRRSGGTLFGTGRCYTITLAVALWPNVRVMLLNW